MKCSICDAEYEPGEVQLFGATENRHSVMWHAIKEFLEENLAEEVKDE